MDKKTYTIFFSYSTKDREVGHALERELSKHGFYVWSERNIMPGEKMIDAFEKALKEADIYILLLTPNSIESLWVNFEIGVAVSRQEVSLVIPVLLKDAIVPPQLSSLQYLDGRNVSTSQLGETISKLIMSK